MQRDEVVDMAEITVQVKKWVELNTFEERLITIRAETSEKALSVYEYVRKNLEESKK